MTQSELENCSNINVGGGQVEKRCKCKRDKIGKDFHPNTSEVDDSHITAYVSKDMRLNTLQALQLFISKKCPLIMYMGGGVQI